MTDPLDAVMDVMHCAFDPAYGEAWTRRQVADVLVMPGICLILAGSDGEEPDLAEAGIAGVTGFALSRRVLDEEEVLLLAVRPRSRGRGIGRRLLERCRAAARRHGIAHLFLEMREGNPAEALYRGAGFEQIGRRPGYYRGGTGGPLDAITFRLSLD